ncbi:MAG: shikimate dehydrogenase [Chloroflexota bacterium]
MAANYKSELVGVFGYPVAENPTGVMQEAAFAKLGLDWRYLTIEVKPEALADAMRGLRAMGMQGINLTIPHKVAVMALLDEIAPDAQMIGAVNTVRRDGTRLIGENTDGKGFMRGIREEGQIDPKGKRIAVLGAGGAARAITVELALAGAAELLILNRSRERGEAMVNDLTTRTKTNARFQHWTTTYHVPNEVDILVNATSIGLYPDVEAMPDVTLDGARADLLVCDVIPNPPETPLIKAARAKGLKVLTGLPMLVYQGAIGFEMWTGHKAPEAEMKAALSKAFGLS